MGLSLSRLGQFWISPTVEAGIAHLQTFDPPGIGARDLRECLMIQALERGDNFSLPLKIISDHFDLFSQLNIEEIARRLGISGTLVSEAFHKLASLDPMPAKMFSRNQPLYIIPDGRVFKVNGEWVIELDEDDQGPLHPSRFYKSLLSKADQHNNEVKEFLLKHDNISRWYRKSIQQRQQTLNKILKSLIKIQRDFLEHGPKYLKPLTLKEVAIDISVHESTVSRITKESYLETPFGVVSLKVFFSASLSQEAQGEEISATHVRAKIQEIIDIEGKNRPLSDQEIVQMLYRQGINIARRTVNKYRQLMGILASGSRKKLFKMKTDFGS